MTGLLSNDASRARLLSYSRCFDEEVAGQLSIFLWPDY